jgi:hypothetical protein
LGGRSAVLGSPTIAYVSGGGIVKAPGFDRWWVGRDSFRAGGVLAAAVWLIDVVPPVDAT